MGHVVSIVKSQPIMNVCCAQLTFSFIQSKILSQGMVPSAVDRLHSVINAIKMIPYRNAWRPVPWELLKLIMAAKVVYVCRQLACIIGRRGT